jgi:hypothetical protein
LAPASKVLMKLEPEIATILTYVSTEKESCCTTKKPETRLYRLWTATINLNYLLKHKLRGFSKQTIPTEQQLFVGEVRCFVVSANEFPQTLISVFWTGAATFPFK